MATTDPPVLRVEKLTHRFGGFLALHGVDLVLRRGELTSIIGPNGAGKSTLFNIISGLLVPTGGRIFFEGRDVTGLGAHRFAHMGIGRSFQITNLFPQLPVLENVRIAVQAIDRPLDLWTPRERLADLRDRALELLEVVGLAHRARRSADSLAHGEQRALEIAVALACRPRLLLLDEPTAGMSPEETRGMMELIVRLARERTVALVEHKMKLVLGISDRIVVLHHGEVLAEGSPAEITANDDVKRVYLGQRAA